MARATQPLETGPTTSSLFSAAFSQSSNAMILVDDERRHVDANGAYVRLLGYRRDELIGEPIAKYVAGGPLLSPAEWRSALAEGRFDGRAELLPRDGSRVGVQFAATSELVTGRYLVLVVAMSTSRWGARFRRSTAQGGERAGLSERECEVVRLVALGSTGPEIANELRIAHDTVRTHVRNAMDKVDARSRAHLVAIALGEGLVLAARDGDRR
jgi:PAS domain S-box-containing protein